MVQGFLIESPSISFGTLIASLTFGLVLEGPQAFAQSFI
jgi:hypothetical protein